MRNYQRKTARGSSHDVLQRAANEVLDKGISKNAAAKQFNVDRMTLTRFMDRTSNDKNVIVGYKAVSVAQKVFDDEKEKDLANHIVNLSNMLYGLSKKACQCLAYEFAMKNNVQVPKSWKEKMMAGQDWWLGFCRRHALSIRTPEATSIARATAFNKPVVATFFDLLGALLDKHQFKPHQIYNCDETGCTTVQKPKAVVAQRGSKQVGSITSQERGELVTVMYAINASGNSVPPMIVFPRVNYKPHFINGAPPGSIGRANPSGWINKELFVVFLKHLATHAHCSDSNENKILLLLDNHETHLSLEAIDFARDNGIVMLTIPPHTSHRLQPLDRAVYGPFKTAYNTAMDCWMRSHPGESVTIYDIPALVNQAHNQAVNPRNITSGFSCTGIMPFNSMIFSDTDFVPSLPTDRPIEQPEEQDQPGPSGINTNDPPNYVSPSTIHPVPKAASCNTDKRKGRKKRHTSVITSSPWRQALLDEIELKNPKSKKSKQSVKGKKSLFRSTCDTSESESEMDSKRERSDDEFEFENDEEFIEGDFVVVKVEGKSRIVNYIARIDVLDGDEYEGIFLRKVPSKSSDDKSIFRLDENDQALFMKEDILSKLPTPIFVGGSSRQQNKLYFSRDLSRWNIGS